MANIPEKIDLTFSALDATTANTLFSGSISALAGLGFTITKASGTPNSGYSLSWTITVPVSGSAVTTTTNTMRMLYNNVKYTVLPTLVASAVAQGKSTTEANTLATPSKQTVYTAAATSF